MVNLMVLYPWPKDDKQFEGDYGSHLYLLHEKMGIPRDVKPYTITKFKYYAGEYPAFYQLFTMPFDSMKDLEAAMASAAMQEVAADANRISTGGAPVILVGEVYD
jgi:uncharacterized protein (TIGR02118 family)